MLGVRWGLRASYLGVKEKAYLVLSSGVRGYQEEETWHKRGKLLARDHKVPKCAWPPRNRALSKKPGISMKTY